MGERNKRKDGRKTQMFAMAQRGKGSDREGKVGAEGEKTAAGRVEDERVPKGNSRKRSE